MDHDYKTGTMKTLAMADKISQIFTIQSKKYTQYTNVYLSKIIHELWNGNTSTENGTKFRFVICQTTFCSRQLVFLTGLD